MQWVVTGVGITAITWVQWYFLGARPRAPEPIEPVPSPTAATPSPHRSHG